MTNNQQRLVSRINDLLDGATADALNPHQLAADYVDACALARQRLDQCTTLLSQGNGYAALQIADTPPSLLDLLATLSFGRLDEWNDYCRKEGLPVAVTFSDVAVDKLSELYERSVDERHPLYKEYRKMRMLRNDRGALQALNQILRRNPGDKTAQGEFQRLESKIRLELLRDLDNALQTQNEERIDRLMRELEQTGWTNPLDGEAVWQAALEKRFQIERENAQTRLNEAFRGLKEAFEQQDYYWADPLETEILTLQEQFKLKITAEEKELFAKARKWLNFHRKEIEEQEEFKAATNALSGRLKTLEGKPYGKVSTRKQLFEEKTDLVRLCKRTESLGRPIPEGLLTRARRHLDVLELEISRKTKLRNVSLGLVGTAVVVLIGILIFFTDRSRTERELVASLMTLQEQEQAIPLDRFLDRIESEQNSYLRRPKVATQVAIAQQWLDQQYALAGMLSAVVNSVRETAGEDAFQGASLRKVGGWFTTVDAYHQEMAPDLFAQQSADILRLRSDWETFINEERRVRSEQFGQGLSRAEEVAGALAFGGGPQEVAQMLNHLAPLLTELQHQHAQQFDYIELPIELADRFTAIKERAADYESEKLAWGAAIEDLEKAETVPQYIETLKQIAQSRFARDHRVSAAKQVLDQTDVLTNWRQPLLMPNDPQGWEAFRESVSLLPVTPLPPERQRFLNLLEERSYPPELFQKHDREGELLRKWMRAGMINRNEGVISVSLLRLVDDLRQEGEINDLFRAYLHQQLGAVMDFRKYQWGLHVAPAFVHDLEELKRIAGQISSDQYMYPMEHLDSLLLPLFRFYAERTSISYYQQAFAFRDLFERALESEMQLAGFVDADGELILSAPISERRVLWTLHAGGRGLQPIAAEAGEQHQPLSPVFLFSYDGGRERTLLQAVFQKTRIDLTAQEHRRYLPPLALAGALDPIEADESDSLSPLARQHLHESLARRKIDEAVQAERDRLVRLAEEERARETRLKLREQYLFSIEVRGVLRDVEALRDLLLGRSVEEVCFALSDPARVDGNKWEYHHALRLGASRRVLEIEFSDGRVTRVAQGRVLYGR